RLLSNNSAWGHKNLAAYESNRQALETTIARVRDRGGRVYPGLAATWGGKFKIGDVPFYAFLSEAQVPAVAFLYHAMALPADIMVRFNEQDPAQYRLFNIRTVVAPAQGVAAPAFLMPREQIGSFRIFDAPGGNYFDVVDALFAVRTTRNNFYDVNDRWLQSDWVAKKQHLQLDPGDNLAQLPRVDPEAPFFPPPALPPPGSVLSERQNGASYEAEVDATRPSFALFRMTWHRNWKAYVDGRPERTVMLSPGFVGVPLTAGRHKISTQYEAGSSKAILALSGFLLALIVSGLPAPPVRLRASLSRWMEHGLVRRLGLAAGIVALALPVSISVMTTRLPDGHDALEYFPRLEEFHENIAHGNLFPRWAPDLSRGTGQPFFEFNPPVIYYMAEIWHLAGFDFLTAVNLATAVLVLASGLSMFLLGRLYFGVRGGWLGAAAYLYAPYFSLDLYVRSALAEFAAFPFFPLALYGFGGYARTGKRAYLLTGAVAYAGVMWSHNAAALLFTPLLIGFIAFTSWTARSWSTLRGQAFGFLLGLGLGACVWVPSLIDRQYVGVGRLLEGSLRYTNHFVYLHQLFDSPWGFGLSVPGDKDGMSFGLGWSHLLIAAGTWILIVCLRRHADRVWMLFFTAAVAVLSALMLENAVWLWDRVSLLQYVEFPWRLLGPVSVCLALLVAPLGPVLASLRRWGMVGFAGVLALLIVPNVSHYQPKGFRDLDLSFWTPQQIATRGIEVTTAAEYVPRWVKVWPAYDPRPARILNGDVVVQEVRRAPTSWSVHIQTKSGGTAEMPISWFPGWEVRVDGKIVETQPADPTGLIRFQVPAGDHVLQAAWTRTPARWLGDGLTLLSLVALAIVATRSRRPENNARHADPVIRGSAA
ncbi:MAG TPA: glycosyltransferase family 39 protein, partial [Bryobacteraceae bacterium]